MEPEHAYEPMMPPERALRLREWHERALDRGRRDGTIEVTRLGRTFVVPPEVYPPHPLGLAELVLREVAPEERVLDLGTGSGVNGIVAASIAAGVLAVDIDSAAVECARRNAELNGVAALMEVRESDLFRNVDGRFDLIVFDPPFRWFRPRNAAERATTDENYETLTSFFRLVKRHLTPRGRILLSFGTTGDIDYLQHLIARAGLRTEELRRVEGERDGLEVAYFAYRLTDPAGQARAVT